MVLPDQNGRTFKLSSLKGKNVVLYFYPKDETPGCTKQVSGSFASRPCPSCFLVSFLLRNPVRCNDQDVIDGKSDQRSMIEH